jgi:hypothetical protein
MSRLRHLWLNVVGPALVGLILLGIIGYVIWYLWDFGTLTSRWLALCCLGYFLWAIFGGRPPRVRI